MAYLRAGMGFLVMTAKPGEAEMIIRYAAEAGRAKDVIRFAPEEPHRFNFLAYLQKLPSRGGGLTSNIVATLVTIQEALEKGNDAATREQYWKDTLNQLLRNAVDLCLLARPKENLSIERLHEVVMSAPVSFAQVEDLAWQSQSLCYRLLDEALQNDSLTSRQRSDLKLTGKYWLTEFAGLPADTRGSIVSTFTSMVDGFLRGVFADLFGTTLTIVPEMTFDGAIIILDLPAKSFGKVGLAAQAIWKHLWEDAVERRDISKNRRPVCLLGDEWHLFITDHDVAFATTSRSSRACILALTQTLANYNHALGGEQKAKALTDSFLGVCQTKVFCANSCPKTNQFAAEVFAKAWTQKLNSGVSHADKGGRTSNAGSSESLEYNVLPSEFVTLRKGGPSNRFLVDTIIHGGKKFRASGTTALRATFSQKG
jgi:hypothetical protein